ncbi:MAG: hypothetical protein M3450_17105 [Actinomycetota bacterium]|nr:hypothetical protein [Actinomycetota bacterium]MDQ3715687.1 hypothetical protein [Actinomycetota bacterium]
MSSRIRTSAIVVMIVGAWGGLVPFVGPLFGYQMGSVGAWAWTESHLTLHLLPGLAAIIGAATMLSSAPSRARLGALIALVGGLWFILGPVFRPAWADRGTDGMMMMGDSVWDEIFLSLGYHSGTAFVIIPLAAYALGALANRTAAVSDDTRPVAPLGRTSTPVSRDRERASVS